MGNLKQWHKYNYPISLNRTSLLLNLTTTTWINNTGECNINDDIVSIVVFLLSCIFHGSVFGMCNAHYEITDIYIET
jgi:hypothetical protein